MNLFDEYRLERDEFVSSVHPDCRAAMALAYQPFTAWCAEQGIEPPAPDLSDPSIARKYKAYLAWKRAALERLTPEAQAQVEPHMTPFVDWLLAEEIAETQKVKVQ